MWVRSVWGENGWSLPVKLLLELGIIGDVAPEEEGVVHGGLGSADEVDLLSRSNLSRVLSSDNLFLKSLYSWERIKAMVVTELPKYSSYWQQLLKHGKKLWLHFCKDESNKLSWPVVQNQNTVYHMMYMAGTVLKVIVGRPSVTLLTIGWFSNRTKMSDDDGRVCRIVWILF